MEAQEVIYRVIQEEREIFQELIIKIWKKFL